MAVFDNGFLDVLSLLLVVAMAASGLGMIAGTLAGLTLVLAELAAEWFRDWRYYKRAVRAREKELHDLSNKDW